LNVGSTVAENLMLEYTDGLPDAQVGWGRVDEATLRHLMSLHTVMSDILQRTPYIAQVQGSDLFSHILSTLVQAETQTPSANAFGKPGDRVVFVVGHDANIANVSALLRADWLLDGYQRNDVALGGALVFELWRHKGEKADRVRVYYTAQTPNQMRNAVPLTLSAPPPRAELFLPGCSSAEQHSDCEWSAFQRMADLAIDRQFVK
jgi:4-phytase/acid phosphatase